ncbi:hypothetical protein LUZ60_017772 [Juncus effusus]|nr:hypothetical protein LUZ60_017772 [Juncus effusus]
MRLFENSLPSQVRTLLGVNSLPYLMGEEYKHTKSMLLSFFNSWEIQTIFLDEVQQHADRILSAWRHRNIIYVGEETHKFALDIIAEKAMGMSFDDPEAELLQREFVTFHKGFYVVPIYLPNTLFGKALKARKNIIKIIKKRVDRKRAEKRNAKPTNWMSCILENDPHESMERICNSVITFLFAGLSNTSIAIALAIYFLGTCPKAVQQMREEHQQIVRGRKDKKAKLAWEDYKNLKFCHCVINETLRLGNILPGVWKKATQDVEFKGYVIPKGTIVLASAASMHLDTNAFERPEVFDPWRWLIMNKTNSWMPFGGGVRYCNGSEFARIEIAIFLLRFMCNYDWEPAELDRPISLPPVVFPRELPIRVYPLKSNVSET